MSIIDLRHIVMKRYLEFPHLPYLLYGAHVVRSASCGEYERLRRFLERGHAAADGGL